MTRGSTCTAGCAEGAAAVVAVTVTVESAAGLVAGGLDELALGADAFDAGVVATVGPGAALGAGLTPPAEHAASSALTTMTPARDLRVSNTTTR